MYIHINIHVIVVIYRHKYEHTTALSLHILIVNVHTITKIIITIISGFIKQLNSSNILYSSKSKF